MFVGAAMRILASRADPRGPRGFRVLRQCCRDEGTKKTARESMAVVFLCGWSGCQSAGAERPDEREQSAVALALDPMFGTLRRDRRAPGNLNRVVIVENIQHGSASAPAFGLRVDVALR